MLLFVLPVYVAAGFIAGVTQPSEYLIDIGDTSSSLVQAMENFETNSSSNYYSLKLTKRLDDLVADIEQHNPDFDYAEDLLYSFKVFCGSDDAVGGYLGLFFYVQQQIVDIDIHRELFCNANRYFWEFNNNLEEYVNALRRVEIQAEDYDRFMQAVGSLHECFDYAQNENFRDSQYNTLKFYVDKRIELHNVWNSSGREIQGILERAENITLTVEHQSELLKVYENEIQPAIFIAYTAVKSSGTVGEFREKITRYENLANVSVNYLQAHHKNLQTDGRDTANKADLAIDEFLIANRASTFDYSAPFSFMNVIHEPTGTTAFDFVFNCFEIIAIPLIFFAVVVVIFCIYDDMKKHTIYQTLVSPQGRKRIIGAKFFAIMWTTVILMTVFFALFYATSVIMLGSTVPPAVLTVFGGQVVIISPWALMFIYLGSLFFKILFFAVLTAFICLRANSMLSILVRALGYITAILLANFFLSAFAFWQFIPILALEVVQYFGVKTMFISQAAAHYNLLFTVPVVLIAFVLLIFGTIKQFDARDF